MIRFALAILFFISGSLLALPVKKDTAATVIVGPFVDYANGKTILADNDDFDPNDIVCRLIKGSSESTLTLTKTGGDNNINLTGYGMATLTLTASNVDTAGQFTLSFCDSVVTGYATETILPFSKSFIVYPANVYNSLFVDNVAIATPTNIRAQVDASMEYYRLDHLLLTGGTLADFVNDGTVMAWMMAIGGDISDYSDATDSQEAVRNQVDQIPTVPSRPSVGGH